MRTLLAAVLLWGPLPLRAQVRTAAPITEIAPVSGLFGLAGVVASPGFQAPALSRSALGLSPTALPAVSAPVLRGLPDAALPVPAAIAAPAPRFSAPSLGAVRKFLKPVSGQGARKSGRHTTAALSGLFDGGKVKAESGELDISDFRVPEGLDAPVDLSKIDASQTPGFKNSGKSGNRGNKKAVKSLKGDLEKLEILQRKLYADGKRSVLIVLQAMDTGGKDGTIRYVLGPLNPQGVRVTSFKKPTLAERAKGFLWRIRRALPGKGMIGVFNRSQYEDILVPTVYGTHDAKTIEKRFGTINEFERGLVESGTVVLKFFLHVSKDEQKRRLQERLDDPDKNWKFSKADLESRAKWDDFRKTYGTILSRTSTPWAPWYLIPSNNKWFRNALIGRVIRETMDSMGLAYPEPEPGLSDIVIPD